MRTRPPAPGGTDDLPPEQLPPADPYTGIRQARSDHSQAISDYWALTRTPAGNNVMAAYPQDGARPDALALDAAYKAVRVSWDEAFAGDPQQVAGRFTAWAQAGAALARNLTAEQHRAPKFRQALDTFISSATRLASRTQATAQDPAAWARVFADVPGNAPASSPGPDPAASADPAPRTAAQAGPDPQPDSTAGGRATPAGAAEAAGPAAPAPAAAPDERPAPAPPDGTRPLAAHTGWAGNLRPERLLYADGTPLSIRGQGDDNDQARPATAAGAVPAPGGSEYGSGRLQVVRWDDGQHAIIHPALASPASIDAYAGLSGRDRARWEAFDLAEAWPVTTAGLPPHLVDAGDVLQVERGPRSRTMDLREVQSIRPGTGAAAGGLEFKVTGIRSLLFYPPNTRVPVCIPDEHPSLPAAIHAALAAAADSAGTADDGGDCRCIRECACEGGRESEPVSRKMSSTELFMRPAGRGMEDASDPKPSGET